MFWGRGFGGRPEQRCGIYSVGFFQYLALLWLGSHKVPCPRCQIKASFLWAAPHPLDNTSELKVITQKRENHLVKQMPQGEVRGEGREGGSI